MSIIRIKKVSHSSMSLLIVTILLTLLSLSNSSDEESKKQVFLRQSHDKIRTSPVSDDQIDQLSTSTRRNLQQIQESSISSSSNNKYLVVFDAVGRSEVLGSIKHSIQSHFSSPEWSCLLFLYVNETKIPDSNPHLQSITNDFQCTLLRLPGLNWGHWLQIVNPTLASSYDRIAIHLDDVFLPSTGPSKISIPDLLQSIEKHSLASISPAIAGAGNHYSTHPKLPPMSHCLSEVEMIEVYFQIFTKDAWACFHHQLHYSNGGGHCYDKCYAKHCPQYKNAVEYRMIGYHLERAWRFIPPEAKVEDLGYLPKERIAHEAVGGGAHHCFRNKCTTRFDIWQTRQDPLECTSSSASHFSNQSQEKIEEVKSRNIIYTFKHENFYNNEILLQTWSNAWKSAGWQTQILTKEHAKKSEYYEYVDNALKKSQLEYGKKLHIIKFLAMSTIPNGGWFSDPTILPLYKNDADILPNNGMFTIHEEKWLGLFSASQTEWERFVRYLVEHRHQPFAALNALSSQNSDRKHAFYFKNHVMGADYEELVNGSGSSSSSDGGIESICDVVLKYGFLAIRVHSGPYLEVIKSTGFINNANVPEYADAWLKRFRERCWDS